ncbi:hypothetical protein HPB50_019398 [Hyalomma asiaticum]|uniref:Uncharacterized protein n=1 Tax=Hyalomma asiaticum TaxID=266040 RepID=A0ACB7SHB2_HYAAI|nr:hypothetical protein HPB50_019398 [Hyalomma asiaticum]
MLLTPDRIQTSQKTEVPRPNRQHLLRTPEPFRCNDRENDDFELKSGHGNASAPRHAECTAPSTPANPGAPTSDTATMQSGQMPSATEACDVAEAPDGGISKKQINERDKLVMKNV